MPEMYGLQMMSTSLPRRLHTGSIQRLSIGCVPEPIAVTGSANIAAGIDRSHWLLLFVDAFLVAILPHFTASMTNCECQIRDRSRKRAR